MLYALEVSDPNSIITKDSSDWIALPQPRGAGRRWEGGVPLVPTQLLTQEGRTTTELILGDNGLIIIHIYTSLNDWLVLDSLMSWLSQVPDSGRNSTKLLH